MSVINLKEFSEKQKELNTKKKDLHEEQQFIDIGDILINYLSIKLQIALVTGDLSKETCDYLNKYSNKSTELIEILLMDCMSKIMENDIKEIANGSFLNNFDEMSNKMVYEQLHSLYENDPMNRK